MSPGFGGAEWLDEQVVTCTGAPSTLASSRRPDDLDAFCTTLVQVFAEGARSAAQPTGAGPPAGAGPTLRT